MDLFRPATLVDGLVMGVGKLTLGLDLGSSTLPWRGACHLRPYGVWTTVDGPLLLPC